MNKRGKIVTKKAHAAGKNRYEKYLSSWIDALQKARKELGIKGFCAVNGKTAQGKALYAKTKAILAAWEVLMKFCRRSFEEGLPGSAFVVVHGAICQLT